MTRRHLGALLAVALAASACAQRPDGGAPSADPATGTPSAQPGSTTPSASSSAGGVPSPDVPTPTPEGVPLWEQLAVDLEDGPSPRESHTWTVDATGGAAYAFGGRDGETVYDDLWAFDLETDSWSVVTPEGDTPPARFGHNAVWVEEIGLVVFAGQGGSTFYNDLWAYDPGENTWTLLPGGGDAPVPRYGSCAALGPDGRLWISHGFTQDQVRFSDTRAYDFDAGEWSDVTPEGDPPVARCLHGCWWTPDGQFALYAGQTTDVPALGDLWALDPDRGGWEQAPGELPPARNLYAFAPWGDEILVFGGQGAEGLVLSDLIRVDANLLAFPVDVPSVVPPGRLGAQMITDESRGRLLLFGGRLETAVGSDIWQLNPPGD